MKTGEKKRQLKLNNQFFTFSGARYDFSFCSALGPRVRFGTTWLHSDVSNRRQTGRVEMVSLPQTRETLRLTKSLDTDRQAALLNFLTEDIKEETIFPARIAEIVDSKNESFLALVALFSLLFFARLHKHQNQTRPNSLNTDDLARLQILKDTAARLLKRHKRKSKIIDLNDFRD